MSVIIALQLSGSGEQISHKSNKDRGIEQQPTDHLGLHKTRLLREGLEIRKDQHNQTVREHNEGIPKQTKGNDEENIIHRGGDRGHEKSLGDFREWETPSRAVGSEAGRGAGKSNTERETELFGEGSGRGKTKENGSKAKRAVAYLKFQVLRRLGNLRIGSTKGRGPNAQTKLNQRDHKQERNSGRSERTPDRDRADTRGTREMYREPKRQGQASRPRRSNESRGMSR